MKLKKRHPNPKQFIINVTTARRDLFQVINRAYFDNHIFLIRKNGKILAQIKGINYRKYTPPLTKAEIEWQD